MFRHPPPALSGWRWQTLRCDWQINPVFGFRLTKLGERPKATRDNVYIDRSLRHIRANEAPLMDISGIPGVSDPAASKAQECRQSPFPLECLGGPLADMGRAVCASERVPEAIAGCGLLGVLSASLV